MAVHIMSGLLASGHYTRLFCEEEMKDEEPRLRAWDAGQEWKKDGLQRRFPRHVVDDALSLLDELEERLGTESSEQKANSLIIPAQ